MDKQNTESDFVQGQYKIIKSTSGYPTLTQANIVKNVSGVYQYELSRFRTTASGITDFQDMRTFLDFDSIYQEIEEEIENIKNGSTFIPKSNFATITGTINSTPGSLDRSSFNTATIDFPDGFNANNCMVISWYVQREGFPIGFGCTKSDSSQTWLRGGVPSMVSFNTAGKILFTLESYFSESQTYNYKIILMKI